MYNKHCLNFIEIKFWTGVISVTSAMPSSEIMVEEALCGLLNPQKHRGPTSLLLMTYAFINSEARMCSYFYRETLLGLQVAMASGPIMLIPTCLVENKNEQLSVSQLVLKIRYKISQPVMAVTIVGLYHTGKSHLMNYFVRQKLGE